jgi:drug/metabolite transporter (DMT)-like permease
MQQLSHGAAARAAGRLQSPASLFAAATLIWGSTWLAIKYQLGSVAPEAAVAYRFALAAVLLGAWCALTGRSLRFSPRAHAFIALQGALLFGLNYVGVYWAEEHATSGLVAVLFSTIVFMNPIGARLIFGTPLRSRTLIAAALGVTGVGLLFLPELVQARSGGEAALGIACGLGATAIASGGNLAAVRNQRAGIPVLPGTAWGMLYGALVAALAAGARGVQWTFDAHLPYLLSLLYLALFGSVVAFGAYLTLLQRVGPARVAYVGVGTPVVALLLSTLFEGYRWTWVAGLGVALAVAANWIALRASAAPGTPAPAARHRPPRDRSVRRRRED